MTGANMFTVPKGADVTVDLNGYNIAADFSTKTDGSSAIFTVNKNASLTINGEGNVHAVAAPTLSYVSSIFTNLGNLEINGGTFSHTRNMFRNLARPKRGENNATLIINGGTFNGQAGDYAAIWNQKTSSSGVEGDGIVTVNGGNFHYVEVTNEFEAGVTIAAGVNLKIAE